MLTTMMNMNQNAMNYSLRYVDLFAVRPPRGRGRQALWRNVLAIATVLAVLWVTQTTSAADTNGVISRTEAQRHGLERQWMTQVRLDRSRHHIAHVMEYDSVLYVLTEGASLEALDAETGRRLWVAQIGDAQYASLGPGVNDEYVAAINGSRLVVLSRESGREAWQRRIGGGAGAGPALSSTRAYVPLVSGVMEGYRVDPEEHKRSPWIYTSNGNIFVQPLVTSESVCWPTDRGILYVSRADTPALQFRLTAGDSILARPAAKSPTIYCASLDGFVYAVDEHTSKQQWEFSSGFPISHSPVVIGEKLYVCPDERGMVCLSADRGQPLWWAPRVSRFVAATPKRVYALDRYDRLNILDVQTGAHLGRLTTTGITWHLANDQTDRIYVGTSTGFLQCLRERELTEPVVYVQPPKSEDASAPVGPTSKQGGAPKEGPKQPMTQPPAAAEGQKAPPPRQEAADQENPFDADKAPASNENPSNPPGGATPPNENPFGPDKQGREGAPNGIDENPF